VPRGQRDGSLRQYSRFSRPDWFVSTVKYSTVFFSGTFYSNKIVKSPYVSFVQTLRRHVWRHSVSRMKITPLFFLRSLTFPVYQNYKVVQCKIPVHIISILTQNILSLYAISRSLYLYRHILLTLQVEPQMKTVVRVRDVKSEGVLIIIHILTAA
jgi:hypothetical protein